MNEFERKIRVFCDRKTDELCDVDFGEGPCNYPNTAVIEGADGDSFDLYSDIEVRVPSLRYFDVWAGDKEAEIEGHLSETAGRFCQVETIHRGDPECDIPSAHVHVECSDIPAGSVRDVLKDVSVVVLGDKGRHLMLRNVERWKAKFGE